MAQDKSIDSMHTCFKPIVFEVWKDLVGFMRTNVHFFIPTCLP